ncbi:hypothetical protein PI95_024075 [Hassallia byssoidea VB512170]|uniref:Uncharacterized protein n=1 Tax=Hassallia byssoidea VB512170 TaxID=1304833 RepID=A0A846HFX7_9CYAN|nr:hypothetical protein [Hassalia byssoidea]NEU75550.1 hypothetical protein [Hassalia byssoidea VB512170]
MIIAQVAIASTKNSRVTTYNYRKHRYLVGDYSVCLLGIQQQFLTAKRALQKRFRMFSL